MNLPTNFDQKTKEELIKEISELNDRINSIVNDSQNHKLTELELIKANEKVEESEKTLNEAQYLSQIGIWNRNFITGTLTWSDELYRIFEIEQGLPYDQFSSIYRSRHHPDDIEGLDRITEGSIKSLNPQII